MNHPAGLASIASTWNDTPQVRAAVDMAKRLQGAELIVRPAVEQAAIDRHAWLVIREAYRSRDIRSDFGCIAHYSREG